MKWIYSFVCFKCFDSTDRNCGKRIQLIEFGSPANTQSYTINHRGFLMAKDQGYNPFSVLNTGRSDGSTRKPRPVSVSPLQDHPWLFLHSPPQFLAH